MSSSFNLIKFVAVKIIIAKLFSCQQNYIWGVIIDGGKTFRITGCDIFNTGDVGICVLAGDRMTLESGDAEFLELISLHLLVSLGLLELVSHKFQSFYGKVNRWRLEIG